MSAPQIVAIAASTEFELNQSPFLPQNPTEWRGAAATEIYGVYLPGRDARSGKYQRFLGELDGLALKDTWTEDEIVNLTNAPVVMTDETDQLEIIVKVNGVIVPRQIETVIAPATAPVVVAGFFSTYVEGGDTKITFGTAPAEGAVIEFFITAAADIVNITIPASGVIEGPAPQVVIADAAVTAIRLTR